MGELESTPSGTVLLVVFRAEPPLAQVQCPASARRDFPPTYWHTKVRFKLTGKHAFLLPVVSSLVTRDAACLYPEGNC